MGIRADIKNNTDHGGKYRDHYVLHFIIVDRISDNNGEFVEESLNHAVVRRLHLCTKAGKNQTRNKIESHGNSRTYTVKGTGNGNEVAALVRIRSHNIRQAPERNVRRSVDHAPEDINNACINHQTCFVKVGIIEHKEGK